HGTITVDSTPYVGTVFVVQLPVAAVEPVSLPRQTDSASERWDASSAEGRREALRILIVDDNDAVRAALQDQCEALDCIGIGAGTGEEAVRQLEQGGIDLVLLDCHLPDVDGYALARRIRREEVARKATYVPIIAISAASGDAHKMRCLESGMDGVVGKPLRLDALRQMIDLWCPAYSEGVSVEQADR
ncbi:response regulator, partial [Burkholderia cenocepacia]|uniref:response regulator n=1 Tax=Burkholderia cenocepacia TaxID=95486 RepID=UPI001B914DA5